MSPEPCQVAVVGGGLAGIIAAAMLQKNGLKVLLLDENQGLGGQYLRTHPPLPSGGGHFLPRLGAGHMRELAEKGVETVNRAQVLAISPAREILAEEDGQRLFTLRPEAVLLAPGAREKFIPFKGWTLPGVISTGAAQILIKAHGVLPGREMMIAGSGAFIYAVAAEVLANTGRVRAILDHNSLARKIEFAQGVLTMRHKLAEGLGQVARLLLARTPIKNRTRVLEARGDGRLEEVVTTKLDRAGNPLPGSEKTYPCTCLAVGNGFVANLELGQLAGCRLEHNPALGGWIVGVNQEMETSVPGVFAAGEITGVAGAEKSVTEGRLAALCVLHRLGRLSAQAFSDRARPLRKERARQLAFARRFNALHAVPAGIVNSLPDDTIICRCEDITMGEIREAIRGGCRTPLAVKRSARVGMGICQGRTCASFLYEMIAAHTGVPVSGQEVLSVRSPVKALGLGTLARPLERF